MQNTSTTHLRGKIDQDIVDVSMTSGQAAEFIGAARAWKAGMRGADVAKTFPGAGIGLVPGEPRSASVNADGTLEECFGADGGTDA